MMKMMLMRNVGVEIEIIGPGKTFMCHRWYPVDAKELVFEFDSPYEEKNKSQ